MNAAATPTRAGPFDQGPGLRRLSLIAIAFFIYGLAFFPLHGLLGSAAAALVALPVLTASWLSGLAGGSVSALLASVLVTIQLNASGHPGWAAAIAEGGGPGLFSLLIIGAMAGRLRDMNDRYRHLLQERQRAEAQLRLQAAALEAAAHGIIITDRGGTISWVNCAFTTLTGYSAAEAIGQNPRFLQSGRQDRAQYEALWKTILAGQVWRGELINRRKDGRLYVEEQTITPVPGSGNEIDHFIAIKQDITQRKVAEEQAQRSLRQLRGLAAIDRAMTNWVELFDTLPVATAQTVGVLSVDAASVHLFNRETGQLEHAHGRGLRHQAGSLGSPDWDDLPGRVARERRIVHRANTGGDEYDLRPSAEGFIAYLGAPLVINGEVKGVLSVYHRERLELTPEMQALFESLALQTAIAVDRAGLFAEVHQLKV